MLQEYSDALKLSVLISCKVDVLIFGQLLAKRWAAGDGELMQVKQSYIQHSLSYLRLSLLLFAAVSVHEAMCASWLPSLRSSLFLLFASMSLVPRSFLADATSHTHIQAPHGARTQQLWDNYWPGSHAIQARYKRVQAMVARRNKGLKQKADWDPTGRGNLADPIKFCRISFPPESFYDQEEFHACLDAIGAKKVRLQWGDSTKATDITGAPAGRDAPDGVFALAVHFEQQMVVYTHFWSRGIPINPPSSFTWRGI